MAIHKVEGIQGNVDRKPQKVKLLHDKGGANRLTYALFPFGYSYNMHIRELRRGDIIVFLDKSEHYVYSVAKMNVVSAVAEGMCQMRYGISIKEAMQIWRDSAIAQGYSDKAINDKECLVVWYEIKEVEYEKVKKDANVTLRKGRKRTMARQFKR